MLSVQGAAQEQEAAAGSDEAAAAAKEREALVAARKARLEEMYQEVLGEYGELAKRVEPRARRAA